MRICEDSVCISRRNQGNKDQKGRNRRKCKELQVGGGGASATTVVSRNELAGQRQFARNRK